MEKTERLNHRWRGVYRVLSNPVRREVVGALMEAGPGRALSLPDAATTPDGRRDPERLRLNLVHHHLPLMAEYGFVQWDRRPLSAERGPAFEEVEAVLGAVDEYENLPRRLVEGCHFLERNGVTP
jgi:hypothetical protein